MLGNPNLPVYRRQIQCRSLGLDVQARPSPATPVGSTIGELVCGNPFPSRPLGFVDDDDGSRFRDTYFSQNPDAWTHGDLIEISSAGHVRMHGRSDGVLNVQGIRIGPAEIYRVLADMPEIHEAMAVEQHTPHGPDPARIVLLVVLRQPGTLSGPLIMRIRRELARRASPAHVPALVVEVDELPSTHSGKRSERAARDAVNSVGVANVESLSNPGSLEHIRDEVAGAERRSREQAAATNETTIETTETRLRVIWEDILGIAPLGSDDNFFDVGGTSLAALRLLYAIHDRLGVDLPLSTLIEAQTIQAMAAVIDAYGDQVLPLVVLFKPGTHNRPLFVVHGVTGDLFELRSLLTRLQTDRPVYGVRARGLDPRAEPQTRIEDMAKEYIGHIRSIQPTGPYALAGYSFGGLVAFEMGRLLSCDGQGVDSLTLIDTYLHSCCLAPGSQWRFRFTREVRLIAAGLRSPRTKLPRVLRRVALKVAPSLPIAPPKVMEEPLPPLLSRLRQISLTAYESYHPAPFPGPVTFIRAEGRDPHECDPLPMWIQLVGQGLTVERIPGGHLDMLADPYLQALADRWVSHLA